MAIPVKVAPEPEPPPPPPEKTIIVRRVERPDLDSIGWVCGKLARLNSRASEGAIRTWLLNMMNDPHALFVRSDWAVALVTQQRSILRPLECRIEFNLGKGTNVLDRAALYNHIIDWSVRLGADRLWLDENDDLTLNAIAKRTGQRIKCSEVAYMQFE